MISRECVLVEERSDVPVATGEGQAGRQQKFVTRQQRDYGARKLMVSIFRSAMGKDMITTQAGDGDGWGERSGGLRQERSRDPCCCSLPRW